MNEPQSMQDLADLASAKRQTSVRQMSILARQQGLPITYTTLSQILAGTYKSVPKDSTIRAIAWLAGVSDEAAFKAAGQPVPGPPFAEELPPGVDNLPAKARKAAIDMLRVLVDMNKDVTGNATYMNQAGETPATDTASVSRDLNVNFRSKVDNAENRVALIPGLRDGSLTPHLDLTASEMFAAAKAAYGDALPKKLHVVLQHPAVAEILEKATHQIDPDMSRGSDQAPFHDKVVTRFERLMEKALGVKVGDLRGIELHPDADAAGNIPLPANYLELAADSGRNYGAEEDARARERGEETQDTEGFDHK